MRPLVDPYYRSLLDAFIGKRDVSIHGRFCGHSPTWAYLTCLIENPGYATHVPGSPSRGWAFLADLTKIATLTLNEDT
jgi:hypothetical protein